MVKLLIIAASAHRLIHCSAMTATDVFKEAKELFQEVCRIFKKTESEVDGDIKTMKEWLQTQHHLPETMGDSHIRNFLILNKFNIEKAKKKIDLYYTVRSLIPEFYEDCNPKSARMREFFEKGYAGLHPKLVEGMYRVYFVALKGPYSISLLDLVQVLSNAAEIRFHEDCFFYDILVLDSTHIGLSDLSKVTPTLAAKTVALHRMYSARVKAVYVINAPPFVSKVMPIVKAVLKAKIFERIHISENDDILKQIFAVGDLPKNYGGNGPSLQELSDVLTSKFKQYQERFDQLDKMRVDESLRPEKLVNDEFLGFYGNFKQLNIE